MTLLRRVALSSGGAPRWGSRTAGARFAPGGHQPRLFLSLLTHGRAIAASVDAPLPPWRSGTPPGWREGALDPHVRVSRRNSNKKHPRRQGRPAMKGQPQFSRRRPEERTGSEKKKENCALGEQRIKKEAAPARKKEWPRAPALWGPKGGSFPSARSNVDASAPAQGRRRR
ncbi:hypothetical protein HPB51_021545 [Rhipicephalus microplus]|uniref:Uncharacterized protein n=1 Tax=Rhipicephalus microplus TaxID=6941 RepID=A0A9J6EIB3_RHIMP|nr:hypothetical protein HPB51_021545 [Rhipicephalus microplus]